MLVEIIVSHEVNGFELEVVFRHRSFNDGGQSDVTSEPKFYIDGCEFYNTDDIYDRNLAEVLQAMLDEYENYSHKVEDVRNESEYD